MSSQVLQLLGHMDYDTPNEVWVPGRHKTARNVIFKGAKGNLRAEIIPGTREIVNASLPGTGTNVCIGRYWDAVKQRVFYFNYNSAGNHGIYIINSDESITTLIQSGVNTNGDILGFLSTVTIDSIDIYYGDSITGDILYFCDSLLRPTKININTFLANTYNPILRSYIDVAKAPPQMPIKAVYENDSTVNTNNVRNTLFQFIYRYVYDDNDRSVWSSASIVPLPNQPYTALTQTDYTLNSRISLFMNTGPANVKSIEVAFRYASDGIVSKYYLISNFIKSNLSLSDNDIFWYKFYNDNNYNPVDIDEQLLLQSLVPQKAGTQALLNGNVIAYGNITEGYDPVKASLSVSTGNAISSFFEYNGLLFFATINGTDSGTTGTTMKVYLYGTGTNTAGAVTTLNNAYANFVINVANNAGSNVGVTYNNNSDTSTVSAILTSISGLLVANGFTQVSLVGNILTMSFASTLTMLSSGTTMNNVSKNFLTTTFQYQPQSAYTLGIIYYDAAGRTNGSTIAAGGSFITPVNNTGTPIYAQLSINHVPPSWAVSYQIIRTPNLTYNALLYWATNGAYSDTYPNILGLRYAYLEIDNITQFNQQLQASEGVVSYSFTPGDRVRISGRFAADGTPAVINSTYDYEVLGLVNSVVVNGITKTGSFLKIYYPTSDIDSNFKFDGTPNFLSYRVLVYSFTKHAIDTQETYFEFGKCFGIGNPGTANAYHIGLDQTQIVSGGISTQPAIITTTNGDYFSRTRQVPIGQSYVFTSSFVGNGYRYVSLGLTLSISTVATSIYTVQNSSQVQSHSLSPGDYTSGNSFFLNTTANPINVRIRCTIPISIDSNGQVATSVLLQAVNSDGSYQLVTAVQPISMVGGNAYNIPVDTVITVQGNGRLHFIIQNSTEFANQNIQPFSIIFDVVENASIPLIEQSFSDVYNLVMNSNGRPSVFEPAAKQITNGVLFRFSRPYEPDSSINGMSFFFPNNFDEFSKDFGSIVRMIIHQRELRIYQQIRVGVVQVYGNYIKDKLGTDTLVTTDLIITPNNIQYYIGDFGLGNQPGGIITNGNVDYFPAVNKGYLCRLSQDGITPLTEIYGMQTWSGSNVSAYNKNSNYQFGGYAKILGTFNFLKDRHGEVVFMLQGASDKTPYTLSFDENENCFSSFYDYNADQIICAGNKLFSFYNGRVFVHDNTSLNANFYGTQYKPSIDLVFNDQPNVKKEFLSVGYTSPIPNLLPPTVPIWTSPNFGDIKTSLNQGSTLVYSDFESRENYYYAALWRAGVYSNVYNIYDVITGDFLKGIWMQAHLECATYGPTWIFAPFMNYNTSPKIL